MTPAWIALVLSIGGTLLVVGASRAQLASARSAIKRLQRSAEDQGRRIGNLEAENLVLFDRVGSKRPRRLTDAGGAVVEKVDDGGSDDDQ